MKNMQKLYKKHEQNKKNCTVVKKNGVCCVRCLLHLWTRIVFGGHMDLIFFSKYRRTYYYFGLQPLEVL